MATTARWPAGVPNRLGNLAASFVLLETSRLVSRERSEEAFRISVGLGAYKAGGARGEGYVAGDER